MQKLFSILATGLLFAQTVAAQEAPPEQTPAEEAPAEAQENPPPESPPDDKRSEDAPPPEETPEASDDDAVEPQDAENPDSDLAVAFDQAGDPGGVGEGDEPVVGLEPMGDRLDFGVVDRQEALELGARAVGGEGVFVVALDRDEGVAQLGGELAAVEGGVDELVDFVAAEAAGAVGESLSDLA